MGCHKSKRHPVPRAEDEARAKEDRLDLDYARGRLDREAYLAAKGRLSRAPSAAPGVASELEAARKELVNLKNRISALREERGRLKARLAVLTEGAGAALDELDLDAHERFAEKIATEEALRETEAALRVSERTLARLEALVARLEAEAAAARVAAWEEKA